ncbi:hypothetical protein A20C1_05362 [marine actinobacterium PHSC20C1]|nr:hypothetical protein A20C1_05362 [marine actinobacterium PHSC20C1]
MTCGFNTSARAIATRCCWPPESSEGKCRSRSPRPTLLSIMNARSRASALPTFCTSVSARTTFSRALRCGNRLNLWNTMPISRRCTASLRSEWCAMRPLLSEAPIRLPSRLISPRSAGSSNAIRRSIVDLPEPDGPRTALT